MGNQPAISTNSRSVCTEGAYSTLPSQLNDGTTTAGNTQVRLLTNEERIAKTTCDRNRALDTLLQTDEKIYKISFYQKKLPSTNSNKLFSTNENDRSDHPMHTIIILSCLSENYNVRNNVSNSNANGLDLDEVSIVTEFFDEGISVSIEYPRRWQATLKNRGYIEEDGITFNLMNNGNDNDNGNIRNDFDRNRLISTHTLSKWIKQRSLLKYNLYTNNCIDYALFLANKFGINQNEILNRLEWGVLIKMRNLVKTQDSNDNNNNNNNNNSNDSKNGENNSKNKNGDGNNFGTNANATMMDPDIAALFENNENENNNNNSRKNERGAMDNVKNGSENEECETENEKNGNCDKNDKNDKNKHQGYKGVNECNINSNSNSNSKKNSKNNSNNDSKHSNDTKDIEPQEWYSVLLQNRQTLSVAS